MTKPLYAIMARTKGTKFETLVETVYGKQKAKKISNSLNKARRDYNRLSLIKYRIIKVDTKSFKV